MIHIPLNLIRINNIYYNSLGYISDQMNKTYPVAGRSYSTIQ